jgi:S1-C subfamily serine protease
MQQPMPRRKRNAAGPVLLVVLVVVVVVIGGVIGMIRLVLTATIRDVSAMPWPSSTQAAPAAGPATSPPLSAADAEKLVNQVSPGLVDIDVKLTADHVMSGTGIVLDPSGLVMTNNHVIAGGTEMIVTDVQNKNQYRAVLVGNDPAHDVAVVQMQDASGLSVAQLGNSDTVQLGDQVAAIGNAGGADDRPSVGTGQVTELHHSATATDENGGNRESLTDLIEAIDGIRAGDSGGALVNTDGIVIGMNVAGGVDGFQGTPNGSGDAIRINDAITCAHAIVDHANATR